MARRSGDPRGRGTSAWLTAVRERTFGTPTEKFLMMTLCDYINGDDECWPGSTTLAPEIGVDPRTIRRTLLRLEEAGVIRRYRRSPSNGKVRQTDAIEFLWEGFLALPLVHHDGDLGDNLSGSQGDTETGARGHQSAEARGHLTPPSSFRTPHIEPPQEEPPVERVFEAWKVSTNRTAATVLDKKRRALITAALKLYPLQDVLDAVRGWENSPHHRGENESGMTYNDLDLLLRGAANIERFRDLARGPRLSNGSVGSPAVPRLSKSRQNSDRFYERMLASERAGSQGDDRLGIGQLAAGDHGGPNGSLVRRVGEA